MSNKEALKSATQELIDLTPAQFDKMLKEVVGTPGVIRESDFQSEIENLKDMNSNHQSLTGLYEIEMLGLRKQVYELEAKLEAIKSSFNQLHDHLDPSIEYGNCIACQALAQLNNGEVK